MNWLNSIFGSRKRSVLREGVLKHLSKIKTATSDGDIPAIKNACRDFEDFLRVNENLLADNEARKLIGLSYHDLGMDYQAVGMRDETERCHERSILIFAALMEIGRHRQIARNYTASCNNQLGILYMDCGELPKAAQVLEKAISLRRSISIEFPDDMENKIYLAGALCNRGNMASLQEEQEPAKEYYKQSLELIDKTVPRCDCGCRDMHAEMLSRLMNHPHWIWTAHNFRRNVERNLADLLASPNSGRQAVDEG